VQTPALIRSAAWDENDHEDELVIAASCSWLDADVNCRAAPQQSTV